ncbi:MAG: cupin domain-containing protein [Candidatus Marinimicrobia bacterium]|nr:cupin domain-containing protein [Candidatus Neomarinimicrobiota bacterium]
MIDKISSSWNYTEDTAKVVVKPWGREIWLNYRKGENIGDEEKKYIMKKLYIKKGTKTSFQYHENKVETNFLIEGAVEAWFEDKEGHIDIQVLKAGSIWTIPSGVKHRIVTLEDIILVESSSPEVDDVIRIEDDTLRGDGRIQYEHDLGNKSQ